MATKITPQQVIVTCDRCGLKCDGYNRKQKGKIYIKQHALDMYGSPAANGSVDIDVCDMCLNTLIKLINKDIESLKKAV